MALRRTAFGRAWKVLLLVSAWSSYVNFEISVARWAMKLLKFKYLSSVLYFISGY
jgi:hypothetical protein